MTPLASQFDEQDGGLVQWMWGDVDILLARHSPWHWSEKRDVKSTVAQMRTYLGTSQAGRSVRIMLWQVEFKTLNNVIAELGAMQ